MLNNVTNNVTNNVINNASKDINIDDNWISATKIKNFMMNDTLCDWLDFYYHKSAIQPAQTTSIQPAQTTAMQPAQTTAIQPAQTTAQQSESFTNYIMRQGIDFENHIFNILKSKFGMEVISVYNSYKKNICKDKYYFDKTLSYMKEGIPIIYQGILWNEKNKTYGIPDFIVRSDYINKIFKNPVIKLEHRTGCKFSDMWHYKILDIKNTTLNLAADGTHLLNNGLVPAYKGQLFIYNEALTNIQNYNSPVTYILGKKWNYVKDNIIFSGKDSFDRPGIINYTTYDKDINNKVINGLEWLNRVKNEGHLWQLNPPSVIELYPNMCNMYNTKWYNVKKELANNIYEITSIWNCGVKHRQNAHKKNIYSWKDINCNSKNLGHNGKKIAPIINSILDINRSENIISPTYIKSELPNKKLNIFIDFETLNELTQDSYNILFMIGIGWLEPDTNLWSYKWIVPDIINSENEFKIFDEMHSFINDLLEEYNANDNYTIYHWSDAEKTIYNKLAKKSNYKNINIFNNSFDLYKLFLNEPIIINGALDFSIKTIGAAMFKHGLIKEKWPDNISDGLNAMIKAKYANDQAIEKNIKLIETENIKNISIYNEADCKVLMEIYSYIKNNMIKPAETTPDNKPEATTNNKPNDKKRKNIRSTSQRAKKRRKN
jgi:hypothetical protein